MFSSRITSQQEENTIKVQHSIFFLEKMAFGLFFTETFSSVFKWTLKTAANRKEKNIEQEVSVEMGGGKKRRKIKSQNF